MSFFSGKSAERVGWFLVATILSYWALYVIMAPVTTSDSHIYNLARLLIVERGGLFNNPLWTNMHQIVFPWGFDAVYYPFLKIGRFENLPAFLCLIGSFLCVAILFRRSGFESAIPFCLLVLLSSPLVVFQASCAKNDIAVGFFVLAAFTLIELARDGARRVPRDLGIAVALGMCAGAKTSGLIPAFLLGAYALGMCWRDQGLKSAWRLTIMFGFSMLLLGSIETYFNNYLIYGRPTGDQGFISGHRNLDGLTGAMANLGRYFFNSLATGLEGPALIREYREDLWRASESGLGWFSLEGCGLASNSPDKFFLLGCHECASNYGIAGLIAIPLAAFAVFAHGIRSVTGRLALLGWILLVVACFTIGWQKFIMRLILACALPLLIAATMQAVPFLLPKKRTLILLQFGFFALAALVPLCSWNRGPKYVLAAMKNRETDWLQEGKIRGQIEGKNAAIAMSQKESASRAVILGPDDGALPFLNDKKTPWVIIPNIKGKKILDVESLLTFFGNKAQEPWVILATGHNWDISLPKEFRLLWEKEQYGKVYLFQASSDKVIVD